MTAFYRSLLRNIAAASLSLVASLAHAQDYTPRTYELSTPDVTASEALRAELPADLRETGVLRVGGRWDAPPYAFFPEGTEDWTGFEADLTRGVAKLLGLELELQPVTNEQTLIGIQSGKYDIGVGFYADLEAREETVTFVTYLNNIFGIIVAKGNPHNIKEVADACGLRTIQTGGNFDYAGALNRVCAERGRPDATRVQVAEGVSGLLALKSNQIDVYFQSYGQQKYFESVVEEPIIALVAPEIGFTGMGLIIAKERKDLQEAVLGAVQELYRIGYYDKLIEKWGFQPLRAPEAALNGGRNSRWWPASVTVQ